MVEVIDEQVDFSHQIFDAGKGAATDRLLRDDSGPTFLEIEPRSVG